MITVINVRGIKYPDDSIIYVGRQTGQWSESPLGNPFKLTNESERDSLITKYKNWLWGKMKDDHSAQSIELRRIADMSKRGDIKLGCWCTPKACHADVIKAAVEYLIMRIQTTSGVGDE